MAKKAIKKKSNIKAKPKTKLKKASFKLSNQQKLIFGSLLIILGVLFFISSYLMYLQAKKTKVCYTIFLSAQKIKIGQVN